MAAAIGGTLAIAATAPLVFKLAFAVTYFAIAWLCLEAARIPDLRALIKQGYETTMRITAMVVFILIGSTCFSVVFLGFDGNRWLEDMLLSLPGGVWGFLIFINLFIFFLAFFLDFFEIAFIILPLIGPVAHKVLTPVVGADAALIWFGVMLCVNMQTSFMHPPFGFALFYLRGGRAQGGADLRHLLGAIPWVGLQLIMVALVIAFPVLVTGLLSGPSKIDPSKVRIDIQAPDTGEIPMFQFGPPTADADGSLRTRDELAMTRRLGRRAYRSNLQGEVDSAALYRAMAEAEPDPRLGEVYRRLAAVEEAHAEFWRKELQRRGERAAGLQPGWRTRALAWLARRFGPQFVLPTLSALERRDSGQYDQQPEAVAGGLPGAERSHNRIVEAMAVGAAGRRLGQQPGAAGRPPSHRRQRAARRGARRQ